MRALNFTPRARADLDKIWDYTADTWGIAQAERYILEIRDTCLALARAEMTGRDASDILPGYRKMQAGRHVVFYRLPDDDTLDVVRILHGRMDFPTHIRPDNEPQ